MSQLMTEPEYLLPSCTLHVFRDHREAKEIASIFAKMDPWKTLMYSSESLFKYLLRPDPALARYAVVRDSQVIGAVCIRYPWLLGPCIELIGLRNDYQGLGIGQQLLAWIEAHIRLKSKNVWVLVSGFNSPAFKFYQKAGFAETACIKDLILVGQDEILMRKIL